MFACSFYDEDGTRLPMADEALEFARPGTLVFGYALPGKEPVYRRQAKAGVLPKERKNFAWRHRPPGATECIIVDCDRRQTVHARGREGWIF